MIAWWIWVIIGVAVAVVAGRAFASLTSSWLRRRLENASQLVLLLEMFAHLLKILTRSNQPSPDSPLNRAAKDAIRAGLLMFNIPVKMVQGEKERVEVRIARSAAFREELLSGLRGSGEPQIVEIDTSLYMEVKLAGPTFEVVSYSPAEQLIIPTPACWEFDVLPYRAGRRRQITLSVSMRIEAEGIVGGRRGVSVLEEEIDVEVNIRYATHRFVAGNWQWLIPTGLALAGTVAAWLVVPF
jgi:hypothetical protein